MEDQDEQQSTQFISARWNGFEHVDSHQLQYEWAIISENKATFAIRSADAPVCRTDTGFEGEPDVQRWVRLPIGQTWAINDHLSLVIGHTYYVVLHASLPGDSTEGASIYSNSNGIVIVDDFDDDYDYEEDEDEDEDGNQNSKEVAEQDTPERKKTRSLLSHDKEKRSQSKKNNSSSSSSGDDNGDDNSLDGEDIAGIVIGCVTFALLVLIAILAVVSKTLYKPEDKYDGADEK